MYLLVVGVKYAMHFLVLESTLFDEPNESNGVKYHLGSGMVLQAIILYKKFIELLTDCVPCFVKTFRNLSNQESTKGDTNKSDDIESSEAVEKTEEVSVANSIRLVKAPVTAPVAEVSNKIGLCKDQFRFSIFCYYWLLQFEGSGNNFFYMKVNVTERHVY